uniref:Uncharacterized protein n=1 Tax=Capra hircus TaxID=9925 RepID=A0A8C2RAA5_CAPHI
MATDSWALAVDEQEAAVKSVSGFSSRRGERSRRAQHFRTECPKVLDLYREQESE